MRDSIGVSDTIQCGVHYQVWSETSVWSEDSIMCGVYSIRCGVRLSGVE